MGTERTGTVTFLFTDIEGSTQRWADDEAAMAAALVRHDDVLKTTIDAHSGHLFKHTGDGVVAVFDSATDAVRAADAARTSLELPVRMGLHTGEAERRGDDYFGTTLNRCARIMDAGHGGQVLVSSATRELIDDPDLAIVDLGRHRLKGIDEPIAVHQVGDGEHPPLRSSSGDVRLPTVSSHLVGRDDIVRRVTDELDEHRLITLTGVGGAGKTRVAIAAASARADRHDLVVLVDFGEISDDEEVVAATCRAVGVADHRTSTLAIALSGRNVLMILDNCEHVLDAAADLVVDVMASPELSVLTTSREGLGIDGERVVAVPGLASDGIDSAAVRMFVERAGTSDAGVSNADLAIVREICERLDGLPLAIELAAARTAVLSPADLLARLDERFQLLTGGRRKRSRDRQKTLRETIDWSYELLDDDERDAFERMSVFGGSFALDSAVEVGGGRPEYEVLDLLEALIDKSLLTTVAVEGEHRYRYLETIRSYAEDRFDARADTDDVLLTFGSHLEALVANVVDTLPIDLLGAARRLRAEIPNLRTGFDHALGRNDVAAATALIAPLAGMALTLDWQVNGWAAEALALDGVEGSPHEPHLLAAHLIDRFLEGRFDLLHDLVEWMLDAARARGIESETIERAALAGYQLTGDDDGLRRLAHDVTERYDADSRIVRSTSTLEAWLHVEPFAPAAPIDWTPEDHTTIQSAVGGDDAILRLQALAVRGLRARYLDDYGTMLQCGSEMTASGVPGSPIWFSGLQIRSFAEFYLGRPAAAIRTADADLDEAYRLGDRSAMVLALLLDALVLESLGEAEAATTIRGRLPHRMTVMFIRELADLDRRLRDRVTPGRWQQLVDAGGAMTPRELQALTHRTAARHLDLAPDDAATG